MTNRFILSLVATALMAGSVSALTINVTPGSLRNHKTELTYTADTQLVLTGTANVTDLALLKDISRTITTLDMSGLAIEEYSYGAGDYFGQKQFGAGELPKAMLLGSAVESFGFPQNATKIGSSAFASSAVRNVEVPTTITVIENNAWENCANLTNVRIPSEVSLGTGVFKNCKALRSVEFGGGISAIPASTFDGDTSYVGALPATVTSVGDYAMRGTALASLDLSNVSVVGDFAFAEMPNLSELILNVDRAMQFGTGAFYGDAGLDSVVSPTKGIPALLMAGASKADRITINAPVVGEAAYANNKSIREIILGSTVSEIKAHAFRNDTNITTVNASDIDSHVPAVDATAFAGLENEQGRYDAHLLVKKGSTQDWQNDPVWSLFDIMEGGSDIGSVLQTTLNISVVRENGMVEINSDSNIDYVAICSYDGLVLAEYRPGAFSVSVNDVWPDKIEIIKVVSGNQVKIIKAAPAL